MKKLDKIPKEKRDRLTAHFGKIELEVDPSTDLGEPHPTERPRGISSCAGYSIAYQINLRHRHLEIMELKTIKC